MSGQEFASIFLSSSDEKLLVFFGYLFIAYFAYKRFNALVADYDTYDAPESARPWTTWIRYHASALVYFFLFAVAYRVLLEYPVLMELAAKNLEPTLNLQALESLRPDLWAPMAAVLLLTWVVPRVPKVADVDRDIRRALQRLGSIPLQVSRMIAEIKRTEIQFDAECTMHLQDDIRSPINLSVKQKSHKTLEYMYLRVCHLMGKMRTWDRKASKFYDFRTAHQRQYNNIYRSYVSVTKLVEQYYRLRLDITSPDALGNQATHNLAALSATQSQFLNNYGRILKEQRRNVREELKDLLENIYTFLSCAVLSEGRTTRARRQHLKDLGLVISEPGKRRRDAIDPNDLALLAVCLVVVVPVGAAVSYALGWSPTGKPHKIFTVWTPMAMYVGVISIGSALFVRSRLNLSRSRFWVWLRPRSGRPTLSYIVAGILSAVAGVIGLIALDYLDFSHPRNLAWKLTVFCRWGLPPFAIAGMIAFHLDNKPSQKWLPLIEGITTGMASVLAGMAASFIALDAFTWESFQAIWKDELTLGLPAMALLGGLIGAVFPSRYRRNLPKGVTLEEAEINVPETISGCIQAFEAQAKDEQVDVVINIAKDTPAVRGDKQRFEQIIQGLLSNALEFTPAGGQVVVQVRTGSDGGVELLVSDNGIGMTRDTLLNAVDVSGDAESLLEGIDEEKPPNLRQVRSLVELHGGELKLDSTVRSGTEALVQFPGDRTVQFAVGGGSRE